MPQTKKVERNALSPNSIAVRPSEFVFFDKKTGMRRLEVKVGEDASISIDQAVNMLAIYCVARRQTPRDFNVMFMAGEDLVEDLVQRTTKLIRTCSGAMTRLPLSRRQSEVLSGIALDLSNKEIAAKLSLSERTVKFHVSAMLEKFSVRRRTELLREAGDYLATTAQVCSPTPEETEERRETAPLVASAAATAKPRLMMPMVKRAGR
jgi:DNA-binding CsgD family transcriptional regulator